MSRYFITYDVRYAKLLVEFSKSHSCDKNTQCTFFCTDAKIISSFLQHVIMTVHLC